MQLLYLGETMKRKLLTLLLLILAVSAVFADGNPWVPNRVLLGVGNDKWTYGFSRNDDDQLSWSENFRIEADNWFLRVDMDGITNRGWRPAWSVTSNEATENSTFYSGRIDYTSILLGFKWNAVEAGRYSMYIEPGLGLAIGGNTNYVFFQNLIHRMGGIREVDLTYDTGSAFYFYPMQSLLINNSVRAFDFEDSSFKVGIDAYAEVSYGFMSNETASLKLSFQKGNLEYFSASIGYWATQNWTDFSVEPTKGYSTMELYAKYINGPYVDVTVDTGFFYLKYYTFLQNHYGYGLMLFDAMKFFQKSSWKESDFTFSYGSARILGKKFTEVEFEFGNWNGLSAIIKTKYVAGDPIDKDAEELNIPDTYYRIKLAYSFYTAGIKYSYPLSFTKDWIEPYAKVSLGVSTWDIITLLNTLTSDFNFDTFFSVFGPSENLGRSYAFVGDIELGLTLLPEGLIKLGNSTVQLSLYGGASFFTNGALLNQDFTESDYNDYNTMNKFKKVIADCMLLRYGFLINFGFDC